MVLKVLQQVKYFFYYYYNYYSIIAILYSILLLHSIVLPDWTVASPILSWQFWTGNTLNCGDHIPWHKSWDRTSPSKIQYMIIAEDPELGSLQTQNGTFQFRQVQYCAKYFTHYQCRDPGAILLAVGTLIRLPDLVIYFGCSNSRISNQWKWRNSIIFICVNVVFDSKTALWLVFKMLSTWMPETTNYKKMPVRNTAFIWTSLIVGQLDIAYTVRHVTSLLLHCV